MGCERTTRIAELNDQLRTALGLPNGVPGMLMMTCGVSALSQNHKCAVLVQVKNFDHFTEDNDQYGEHDFGCFDQIGVGKIFWKIDYFADKTCEYGSEAPEDPKRSFRVLTIMLAEEY